MEDQQIIQLLIRAPAELKILCIIPHAE